MMMPDPSGGRPEPAQRGWTSALVGNEPGHDDGVTGRDRLQSHVDIEKAAATVPHGKPVDAGGQDPKGQVASIAVCYRTLGERKDIDQPDEAGGETAL